MNEKMPGSTPDSAIEKKPKFIYIPYSHIDVKDLSDDSSGEASMANVVDENYNTIVNLVSPGYGHIEFKDLYFSTDRFSEEVLNKLASLEGVYLCDEKEEGQENIEVGKHQYDYVILDPRITHPKFGEQAKEANAKLFSAGKVMGIEVTIPELASQCELGNIDPQHTDNDINTAAIELARIIEMPEGDITFATIRPDLDSIGSMAVLTMREEGTEFNEDMLRRIDKIATSDKFANGDWPGIRNLPTIDNMYEESDSATDSETLAAIAAATGDFKVSVDKKVEWLREWIETGAEPEGYREQVSLNRLKLANALEDGQIKIEPATDNSYCVVESTHRAATSLGYTQAPVVVAMNPKFIFGESDPVKKFTISQFKDGYLDMKSLFQELNEMEEGWGGSPTIGGSPQGTSSILSVEDVVSVVKKHIISQKDISE